jgi:hypothetical protein
VVGTPASYLTSCEDSEPHPVFYVFLRPFYGPGQLSTVSGYGLDGLVFISGRGRDFCLRQCERALHLAQLPIQ